MFTEKKITTLVSLTITSILSSIIIYGACSNDDDFSANYELQTYANNLMSYSPEPGGGEEDIEAIPIETDACAAWALATILKRQGYIKPGKKRTIGFDCYQAVCEAANNEYTNMSNLKIKQVASTLQMGLQNEYWINNPDSTKLTELEANKAINNFIAANLFKSNTLLLTNDDAPKNHTSIIKDFDTERRTIKVNGTEVTYIVTKINTESALEYRSYYPEEIYEIIY